MALTHRQVLKGAFGLAKSNNSLNGPGKVAAFLAYDRDRGYTQFPKFFHPWDPNRPLAYTVSLKTACEAVSAVGETATDERRLSDLQIIVLGRAILQLARHLWAHAKEGDSNAAKELWDIADYTTSLLEIDDAEIKKHLTTFARRSRTMPALVGTLKEDHVILFDRITELGLAVDIPERRLPRASALTKKTPAINGTPMNRVANELIQYLETLRCLRVVHGKVDRKLLKSAALTLSLYRKIKRLPRLEVTESVVSAWHDVAKELMIRRYKGFMQVHELSQVGTTKIAAGREEGAEAECATALKQSIETLAPDAPTAE